MGIYLYLPQKCGILQQIATKVCCFTTDCHKSVVFLLQFTDIYHISVVFYYSLTQKCGLEMYPKMGYKLTMYPKYPTWGTDGVQKLVLHKKHKSVVFYYSLPNFFCFFDFFFTF